MTDVFPQLGDNVLRSIAIGLRSGRLTLPSSTLQISRIVAGDLCSRLANQLTELSTLSFTPAQIAILIDSILADREASGGNLIGSIDLVTSGPEAEGVCNRDTAVVVDEMFKHARESVLVVGYAVYQGQKVFESLASRMMECPNLDVTFFLDIARAKGDETMQGILVSRFVSRFKNKQWPVGHRLPQVYYDPRSSIDGETIRSSLHAKCIVVDRKQVFVSSANFTEAGQRRNIEVGLRIDSLWLAERLIHHFTLLKESGLVEMAI